MKDTASSYGGRREERAGSPGISPTWHKPTNLHTVTAIRHSQNQGGNQLEPPITEAVQSIGSLPTQRAPYAFSLLCRKGYTLSRRNSDRARQAVRH